LLPQTVYGQLLQLGIEFARLIDVGFTDCMVVLADCCTERVEAARHLGFVVIATIPASVDIAGVGLRPDLLMAKSISYESRPVR
jgi:hypothetical protein